MTTEGCRVNWQTGSLTSGGVTSFSGALRLSQAECPSTDVYLILLKNARSA